MTSSVGINGFGRMGRLGLRAAWGRPDFRVTRVNEIATDAAGSAHLLKFDSVHGVWPVDCSGEGEAMWVAGEQIAYTANSTIPDTDWSACDIVIEATGRHHKSPQSLQAYFDQGVKKVVVAAPTEGALNIVYGINDQLYDPQRHHLVTAASCTTNCLAPVVKVILDNFGVRRGLMTTIHAYTNDQVILDMPHKDLRRARAAGMSMIPTTTGAAKATSLVIPEVEGKMDGMAIRVPTADVSLVDLTVEVEKETDADGVRAAFRAAADGPLKGILQVSEEPLVSVDFTGSRASSIVDAPSTAVMGGNLVKVLSWYDNEWGYSERVVDLIRYVGERL